MGLDAVVGFLDVCLGGYVGNHKLSKGEKHCGILKLLGNYQQSILYLNIEGAMPGVDIKKEECTRVIVGNRVRLIGIRPMQISWFG